MAHYDLHSLLIRKTRIRVIEQKIEDAKQDGRNDDFVDLLAAKRRLEREIREMMVA